MNFALSDLLIFYKYGIILKTTDGGESWTSKNSKTDKNLNCITFKDNNTGFAVADKEEKRR